jgi:hypothetical protein
MTSSLKQHITTQGSGTSRCVMAVVCSVYLFLSYIYIYMYNNLPAPYISFFYVYAGLAQGSYKYWGKCNVIRIFAVTFPEEWMIIMLIIMCRRLLFCRRVFLTLLPLETRHNKFKCICCLVFLLSYCKFCPWKFKWEGRDAVKKWLFFYRCADDKSYSGRGQCQAYLDHTKNAMYK